MKPVKILHIGDMQNGFTRKDGYLYVHGAHEIIDPANNFLRQIKDSAFDYIFVILDTHFGEEYYRSEESTLFPIHCEYGTKDWELSIDISDLTKVLYLLKNKFTIWGEIAETDPLFTSPERKNAYDRLFHLVDDPYCPTISMPRDEFIQKIRSGQNPVSLEVTMFGVASDYCIRYAMEGWLLRGAKVTIISDLTKGIEKETPQLVGESAYRDYEPGRLRAITSTQFLSEMITE